MQISLRDNLANSACTMKLLTITLAFAASSLALATALKPEAIEPKNVVASTWKLEQRHCNASLDNQPAQCYAEVRGDDYRIFVKYIHGEYAEPFFVLKNNAAVHNFYIDSQEFYRITQVIQV